MARKVSRVIGVGELLEDQLAVHVSPAVHGHMGSAGTRSPDEWIGRQMASLKRRLVGNGKSTVSISQSLKMAEFSEEFCAALAALPDEVEIDSVGTFAVVRDGSRSHADTWTDRCRRRVEIQLIYNEVRSVLADLATALSRLDIGEVRLGGR